MMDDRISRDDLLHLVVKPSRYLGGEVNAVRKDRRACRLSVALAFPDTYEVGMSHLGLQILYELLNGRDGIIAERVYAPWPDMEGLLRRHAIPLATLESGAPLRDFDLVGFSLQYELSFTNVLAMLELGGIPLRRTDRRDGDALVIAGGPCCFNPAPMTAFIDAFVVGEGEEAIIEIATVAMREKERGTGREALLAALAELPGVYVPAVHTRGERIGKRVVADLNAWRLPARPLAPLMKTIHDRAVLEIARGCSRGCRFCQAGMVWRPVRERRPEVLTEMADRILGATGQEELSLLSLSSGDHTCIETLLPHLMDRYYDRRVALALPSLRVETLSRNLIEAIRRVRKTSFTLAPEAGTQRLRNVINKGNTEEELLATATQVFSAGWRAVKLYFMIGLPGEKEEDLEGIVNLAHQVLHAGRKRGQVTVALSTFVPKPHTPFQWERQLGPEETALRQDYFKSRLRHRQIRIKWHDAGMSRLEGLFSRGDERLGDLVELAYRNGCRFDGWSDRFRPEIWEDAIRALGIDVSANLAERPRDAAWPWAPIDAGVERDFLWTERQKAQREEQTPDCRRRGCYRCGACDHIEIRPLLADAGPSENRETAAVGEAGARPTAGRTTRDIGPCAAASPATANGVSEAHTSGMRRAGPRQPPGEAPGQRDGQRFRLRFTKLGRSRHLSHLETAAALVRGIVRGGRRFLFTAGFHPHPRMAFAVAAAVGLASEGEYCDVVWEKTTDETASLPEEINPFLPEGMRITELTELAPDAPSLASSLRGFQYTADAPPQLEAAALDALEERITAFLAATALPIVRNVKDRAIIRDIRPLVTDLIMDRAGRRIIMEVRFTAEGAVRPEEILVHALGLDPSLPATMNLTKRATFFVDK
ncbi:MAG: TIGR03960 family B12-binding radical SAM protein [Pseudomonadota bacterium]|nr:TIGR03960 family B12-binding radical SAM protein [Pseudomonadota bacterium]